MQIELDLPAVNADLFSRLKEETTSNVKAKAKVQEDILKDDRFSSLFTDKNFQVGIIIYNIITLIYKVIIYVDVYA